MDKDTNYNIRLERSNKIKHLPKAYMNSVRIPMEVDADGVVKEAIATLWIPDTVTSHYKPKIALTLNVMGKKTTAYFGSIVEADCFFQTMREWWDTVAGGVGASHNRTVADWETMKTIMSDAVAHRLQQQQQRTSSPLPKDTQQ